MTDHELFWSLLGLTRHDLRVYERFVRGDAAPGTTACREAGSSIDQWNRSVAALEEARLLRRIGERFVPVDARAVLPGLARSRQAVLDQVASVADELGQIFSDARRQSDPAAVVTVLRGGSEILEAVLNAYEAAKRTLDGTVAPPYAQEGPSVLLAAQAAVIARGIRFRSVYDSVVLANDAYREHVRSAQAIGEESRVLSQMSLKLLIVDGERAIVPLSPSDTSPEPVALQISSSALTSALARLFEFVWDSAAGLSLPSPGDRDDVTERLELLLLGGMSDGAVAQTLGISDRTLRRRISALQVRHRATNRVQLGAALSERRRPDSTGADHQPVQAAAFGLNGAKP